MLLRRASDCCFILADAIERFARLDERRRGTIHEQYLLGNAIAAYEQARLDAAEHLARPMCGYDLSFLYINASDDDLLVELRLLRGPEAFRIVDLPGGARRHEVFFPFNAAARAARPEAS
jgi:hypothetical protein